MVWVFWVLGIAGCCCPLLTETSSTGPVIQVPPPTVQGPTGGPGAPTTIGPPTSPGGPVQVNVGGQNVWPPQGPGCERLVSCCDAASAVNSAISLSCRLSVARQPVDCAASLTQVRNIMREMNVAEPAACAGP